MTTGQPPYEELRAAHYIKSPISGDGNSCVRVGTAAGWIGIQDDKEWSTTPADQRITLGFTKKEFAAFVEGAKTGAFDHLI